MTDDPTAYRHADPIDHAEQLIVAVWDTAVDVADAREHDPAAYPAYGDPTIPAVARRIIAALLNAGWVAPDRDRTTVVIRGHLIPPYTDPRGTVVAEYLNRYGRPERVALSPAADAFQIIPPAGGPA